MDHVSTVYAMYTPHLVYQLYMYYTCQVLRGHQRSDGLLGDYCDGSVYKSHALFSHVHQALQIIAYYDDVEVCNPLGSRAKKHKLGKIRK